MFTRGGSAAVQSDSASGAGTPWWQPAPHTAHTAQSHTAAAPPATPHAAGRAGTRAGAREANDPAAQQQPAHAADHAFDHAFDQAVGKPDAQRASKSDPADDRGSRKGDGWAAAARALLVPPDIWEFDRPSLAQIWAYAARGPWTSPTGAPRRLGQAYAVVIAAPVTACCYWLAWLIERPSRLAAAAGLLFLLAQFPPLSWLI